VIHHGTMTTAVDSDSTTRKSVSSNAGSAGCEEVADIERNKGTHLRS
jgi:hypothetical protein